MKKLLSVLLLLTLAAMTACSTTANVQDAKKPNCKGGECCADSAPIR